MMHRTPRRFSISPMYNATMYYIINIVIQIIKLHNEKYLYIMHICNNNACRGVEILEATSLDLHFFL